MDARPKTVREILHTGDQYLIPLFQRYYSWQKEHWDQLRRDIWALMEDGDEAHFLGPLVCTRTAHFPGSVPAYQLIDGQQRLTTLTLLLAAIRDVAIARGISNLPEEVSEDYLLHKRRQGIERYKVLPRLGDREALMAIVEGHDVSQFADSAIFHALKYFRRYAEHWARQNTEKQLRKLLDTVTGRLLLVVVTIDSENPYAIFESLNATGLPLAESDLIRNFIFMQVPLATQQSFHDQHWKALEDLFNPTENEGPVPMTPFYRDYLMKNGQYSKDKATFADFKKHQKEAALSPEQQVRELIHFASLDLMIRRPLTVKGETLRRLLTQVDGMEIATAYPLILNLLDRHSTGHLSADDLHGCLSDLVSFVLRRSLCGETTRQYNKWFVEAITAIKSDPRRDLEQYWLKRRWPDDTTLGERLTDFPLYRREGRKARVILEAIETSFGHKETVDLSQLSIEHIMPQAVGNNAAGKAWKTILGDNWQELHEKLLHTLGNLTLTGYNPDLSNSSFARKKELLADSHLELNTYFNDHTAWTAETIKTRSLALAGHVSNIWPRPTQGQGYKASAEALPEPEGLSDLKRKRLEYWRHLDARLEDRGIAPDLIEPQTEEHVTIPLGTTGAAEVWLGFLTQYKRLYVSLVTAGDVGEAIEEHLKTAKDQIEKDIGYHMNWDPGDIHIIDDGVTIWDREDWPVQHDWLGDRLEDFLRVFKTRTEAIEQEVLKDPALRGKVEFQQALVEYWKGCAAEFAGSQLTLREPDISRGRTYCRFEKTESDVWLGLWYSSKHSVVGVYFKVGKNATRRIRTAFKDLTTNALAEIQAAIDSPVEWSDPYLSVSMPAKLEDKTQWNNQYTWLRSRAESLSAELNKRLELDT